MEYIVGKILALFFSLMILGNAYLVRRIVGTWVFPACIHSLVWFLYTFLPLLFVFSAPVEPLSILYILLANMSFTLSYFVFDWKKALHINMNKTKTEFSTYGSTFLKVVLSFSIVGSLLLMIVNSYLQNITLNDILFDMIKSSGKYAQLRYDEEITINIYGQLSLLLSYVAAVVGGLVVPSCNKNYSKIITLGLSLLPSIFIMITQSAKGAFMFSIVALVAGLLVTKVHKNDRNIITRQKIGSVVAIGVIVVALFAVSFMSRGVSESSDAEFIVNKLMLYFNSYAFAHVYSFSDWFCSYIGKSSVMEYDSPVATNGFYTFMAIFKLFGSEHVVPQGTYAEYFSFQDVMMTNIYTIYRGLIQDFSIFGSFIYMMIIGFIFHLSFYIMMINKKPSINAAVFIVMVLYSQNGQAISMFMYNNVYVLFVLMCVIFAWNNYLSRSKKRISEVYRTCS